VFQDQQGSEKQDQEVILLLNPLQHQK